MGAKSALIVPIVKTLVAGADASPERNTVSYCWHKVPQ